MKLDYWRVTELRSALIDGAAVAMRPGLLAGVALGGTALFLLISLPVWFVGRCVFVDEWYPIPACDPFPGYGPGGWALYVAGLFLMSVLYAGLHWATLRYELTLRGGWLKLHATAPFALVCGWGLGRTWASSFTAGSGLSAFGELLWGLTVPATLWLLGVHFRWWAMAKARYWTSPAERVQHIVRMLVCRYLRMPSPNAVRVVCEDERISITAPVDAVDARRIEDIVMTRFPDCFLVAIHSTLPDDRYWAVYRSQLGPSGYVSPALKPPRPVPVPFVAGLVIVGFVLVVLAFRYGPGLGPGIDPDDIGRFFGVPSP